MEMTYYFFNNFHGSEEVEDFLLHHVGNLIGDKSALRFAKQEESEEGEGDTLYVKCDFFSFTTTLFDVKNISRDYDVNVNYGLEFNIYENGNRKFIEFLGNLLKSNDGGALLLKDSEYKILERRKNNILVDSHFFNTDYEALNLPYIQGTYKKICLRIEGNFTTNEIKLEGVKIVEDHENQYKVKVVEDPDYSSEFTINWGDLQLHISNVGTAINLICNQIFGPNDISRLKRLLCFFEQFTIKFTGDYQLMMIQGYWEQRKSVLLARKNGRVTVNNQAEEACLLSEINFKDG
ncbi:hypothetical protein [Paenibacillus pabuli]|uniref:hypothetical protein n=1 Tax=Paenibacillus pabuli TaxID=1472 RepID=UPI001FFF1627|nr:hypothetical protein [Paenibacillus pabuli]UPK44546.1 hypothetical protein KET34_03150 [Paenibacillus pabuli]